MCVCVCLQDGLDAPPEEWPATGALEDDEDLPIEALMDDDDEDEDLSLAALLRRQMLAQQGEEHSASSSKVRRLGCSQQTQHDLCSSTLCLMGST
jgi:hypothetical protein